MEPELRVAWAAGLFEGEGCFTCAKRVMSQKKNTIKLVPTASLKMTDGDVVRTFASIVSVGKVYGPYENGYKPHFIWSVSKKESYIFVVQLLGPYMHRRRRERMLEVLELCGIERLEVSDKFGGDLPNE